MPSQSKSKVGPKVGSSPAPALSGAASRPLSEAVPGFDDLSDEDRQDLLELVRGKKRARKPVRVKGKPADARGDLPAGPLAAMVDGLRLQRAFGAVTMEPVNARIADLLEYLASVGLEGPEHLNAALAFVDGMEPQDQAEAMLLVQSYVTHDAALRTMARFGAAEMLPHAQTLANLAVKLMRTFQGQMETRARMRRGGEQIVRHIHVDNRGGQAVIADTVQAGGQGNGKADKQPHAQGACSPPVLGQDPFGHGVSVTSHSGEEPVPTAWWPVAGGAQG